MFLEIYKIKSMPWISNHFLGLQQVELDYDIQPSHDAITYDLEWTLDQ